MNVETKMKLMLVMESYWDVLPPELHDYILMLKRNQEMFDLYKEKRMEKLGQDIKLYKVLKDKWALGHIRCTIPCCRFCHDPCMSIYGYYMDEENVKRTIFLGNNFKRALQRLNHVKSFI